jgi:hypothetical protein
MTVSRVHRTPRFDRALRHLRKKGGRALIIAEKAEGMLESLLQDGDVSELGKQTRNGEYRIGQCFKFDLGGGYRLVCLIQGECLIVLYAGTHDDCCRWIERNKGMKYDVPDKIRGMPVAKTVSTGWSVLPPGVEEERRFSEAYEKSIMVRLDDEMLRRIWGCGAQIDCP